MFYEINGSKATCKNKELKKIFLTYVDKKRDFEIDIAAPSVGKGKYSQHVSFHWPPLEAALSVLYLSV